MFKSKIQNPNVKINPKSKIQILKHSIGFVICALSFVILTGGCTPGQRSGKITVTVWHWMTDRKGAFEELSRKYEELTGIKVKFDLYAPSDAYTQKVRAAAQGQTLPDIFGILGEMRDFASFIKAGYVVDITHEMEKDEQAWKKQLFAKALEVNQFSPDNTFGVRPGIYGVPIDIMTIQMVYNKDLFKKLGLNPNRPPQTFQEFLDIGKKIKENNMQGLVSGWAEVWMIDCLANNFAFNLMGEDKVVATIKGDLPYTDPDWIKVLTFFKEMQDAGVLYNGIVTTGNKNSEQLFANERAVFAFNGSWCVNVYRGMNPDLNYGVMLPPKVSDEFPRSIWGGAGSSFMVNAKSRNVSEAINFLKWLTEEDQQVYLAETTKNLPSNKNSLSKISHVLAGFADDMDITTHPRLWGVSEFPRVIEALDKGIQSIIIGEKTPQEIAQYVQQIKEKELAKKKKMINQ
jgi:raffinose/stachyose/melibiose transport system substrate-binding protein